MESRPCGSLQLHVGWQPWAESTRVLSFYTPLERKGYTMDRSPGLSGALFRLSKSNFLTQISTEISSLIADFMFSSTLLSQFSGA